MGQALLSSSAPCAVMKVVLGPCSLVIEDGPSRILLPRLCFGEGCGGGPPSCMLSLGSIILGNGEKTGMGEKGQRKWEKLGGSCNVGMWGCGDVGVLPSEKGGCRDRLQNGAGG